MRKDLEKRKEDLEQEKMSGVELMRLMGKVVGDEILLLAADIQELENRVQNMALEYCGDDKRPDVSAVKNLIKQANEMLDDIENS